MSQHPDTPRPAKRRSRAAHMPAPPAPPARRRALAALREEPTFAEMLAESVKSLEDPPPATRAGGRLKPTVQEAEKCARAQAGRLMQYLRRETTWLCKVPRFSDFSEVWCIYEQLPRDCRLSNAPTPAHWGPRTYAKAFSVTDFLTMNWNLYNDGSDEFEAWSTGIREALSRVMRDMEERLRDSLGFRVVAGGCGALLVIMPDGGVSRGSTQPDSDSD